MEAPPGFRQIDLALLASRDCSTRACPNEAEAGSERCYRCLRAAEDAEAAGRPLTPDPRRRP